MINLYFSTPLSNPLYFNKLPLAIQQRIARRKRNKNLSITGYYILQQVLERDFGVDLKNLSFLPSGKPILEGQEIHFSISHSQNLVGVAISRVGEIGLDIESFRKFERIDAAFSFFSSVEQDYILAAPQPERTLIELWSKKEALIKAMGSQMFDDAAKTDVRLVTTNYKEQFFFFTPIKIANHHIFHGEIWLASSFPVDKFIVQDFLEIK